MRALPVPGYSRWGGLLPGYCWLGPRPAPRPTAAREIEGDRGREAPPPLSIQGWWAWIENSKKAVSSLERASAVIVVSNNNIERIEPDRLVVGTFR